MKTKNKCFTLICMLLFPVYLSAQSGDTTRMHTLLWEISGKGLKQSSYLLGTHHLFGGSFLDSLTHVLGTFNQAELLIGESYQYTNPNALAPSTDHIPYSKLFTTEQYNQVNNYLNSIGVDPLPLLDSVQFPAWRLYFVVQMDFFSKKFKTATLTESAMDFRLYELARNKQLETVALDSLSKWKSSSPAELFGKPEQIADAIISMINYIEKGTPSIHISIPMQEFNSINDYRELTIQYQFNTQTPGKDIPAIKELVIKRNSAWLKVLPTLLQAHSCFIAVGIKHLMYREGLIMQLKKMGYKVTPVAMQRK